MRTLLVLPDGAESDTGSEVADFWVLSTSAPPEVTPDSVRASCRSLPEAGVAIAVQDGEASRALCDAFSAAGCPARELGNGVDLVEELKRSPAQLVILDLFLPQGDAIGLLGEIRRDDRSSDSRIVIRLPEELTEEQASRLSASAGAAARNAGRAGVPIMHLLGSRAEHDRLEVGSVV